MLFFAHLMNLSPIFKAFGQTLNLPVTALFRMILNTVFSISEVCSLRIFRYFLSNIKLALDY